MLNGDEDMVETVQMTIQKRISPIEKDPGTLVTATPRRSATLLMCTILMEIISSCSLSTVQEKTSPPVKMDLATTLKTKFQEIARSDNDQLKTNIYYNDLLPNVADENMPVKVTRNGQASIFRADNASPSWKY